MKTDPIKAKLHGEVKVIQRCFDDNNDDNKRWWQRWWQKAQRSIKGWVQDVQEGIKNKDELKMFKKESWTIEDQDSRWKVEEHFKIQEEGWIQESRFKDQASRIKIKIQDSRIKRRLNQDKYEKDFSKTE